MFLLFLIGLCPFHKEKTPSFTVSQDKQIYKCFGCGQGGTVIQFISKMENLDFRETLEVLSEKANIKKASLKTGFFVTSKIAFINLPIAECHQESNLIGNRI